MANGLRAFTVLMDRVGKLHMIRGIKTAWSQDIDSRVVALGGSKGLQILVTGSKPGQGKRNQILRTVSLVRLSRKTRSLVGEIGLEDHPDNAHAELESGAVIFIDLRRPKGVPATGASSFHVASVNEGGELPTVIGCATTRRNMKTGGYLSTDALIVVPSGGRVVIHPNGWSGCLYDLTVDGAAPILKLSREARPEDKLMATAELRQVRRAIARAANHLDLLKNSVLDVSSDLIRRTTLNREIKVVAREIFELKKVVLEHENRIAQQVSRARKTENRRKRRRAE